MQVKLVDDKTIKEYLPLVRRIVLKFKKTIPPLPYCDLEDFYSIGILVFLEIIKEYDPSKGLCLKGFLYERIPYGTIDYLRKHHILRRKQKGSFGKHDILNLDNETNVEKIASDKNDPLKECLIKERNLKIYSEISLFEGRNREIIDLCYYKGKTFKEAGKIIGISESAVSQRFKQISFQLRKKLNLFQDEI